MTKYTLKQKHDWFKLTVEHVEKYCNDPDCEIWHMFYGFLAGKITPDREK